MSGMRRHSVRNQVFFCTWSTRKHQVHEFLENMVKDCKQGSRSVATPRTQRLDMLTPMGKYDKGRWPVSSRRTSLFVPRVPLEEYEEASKFEFTSEYLA